MARRYPILVERFKPFQGDIAVCERCDHEFKYDPTDGDPEDLCIKHDNCGGQITWKYDEGEVCRNCRRLGYWARELDFCCSRRCQLQAQYATQLRGDHG